MSDAREAILGRIARANGSVTVERTTEYHRICRDYKQSGSRTREETIELFADRLHDYGCGLFLCDSADLPTKIGEILLNRGRRLLLVPDGFSSETMPAGLEFRKASGLTFDEIDAADGVVTGCSLAIAETGTIAIAHSTTAGSRALTLIPDYHLCVVREEQVVETVPEGIQRLGLLARAPLTTISGPSATSDIEMTRVKGVHGPRTLDVLLVYT